MDDFSCIQTGVTLQSDTGTNISIYPILLSMYTPITDLSNHAFIDPLAL